MLRVPAGAVSDLAPGQSFGGTNASITLPLGLPNGLYDVSIGAVANAVDGPAESNLANNRQTVRIAVFTPVIGRIDRPARSPFSLAIAGRRDAAPPATTRVSAPSPGGRLTR